MNVVLWMAVGSVGAWLLTLATVPAFASEIFLGMMGPFVAVAATWLAIERAYRVDPRKLNAIMVGGFALKAVFFAVYVAVVVTRPGLDRQSFVASFAAFFIALYVVEALCLARLFRRVAS